MLRGLIADFKAAGHSVTVLLDSRVAFYTPPFQVDDVVKINSSGEADPSMETAAETADAAFVIAPEPNHILQSIVDCIETTGTLSLNCKAAAIEQAADKTALTNRAKNLGLRYPQTLSLLSSDPLKETAQTIASELGFPAVIKPASSAGCTGLSIAKNTEQAIETIRKIKIDTAAESFLAQEFIQGVPASVSLICMGTEAIPVSLNLQDLALAGCEGESTYNGGAVPLEHPLRDAAFSAAKRLVESFGELRGYVGVDLTLTGDEAYVMEINPRLTTSYVGLRKTVNFNPAQAILGAVLKNKLPENPQCCGCSVFSKFPISGAVNQLWQEICNVNGVVSPPFPAEGNKTPVALLESTGPSFEDASRRLDEAKMHLTQIVARGRNSW